MRRYNVITASEIAIIMPGDKNANTLAKDVVLHKSVGGIKRISSLNSLYDPLHYVLLFPNGETGFNYFLIVKVNEKI